MKSTVDNYEILYIYIYIIMIYIIIYYNALGYIAQHFVIRNILILDAHGVLVINIILYYYKLKTCTTYLP